VRIFAQRNRISVSRIWRVYREFRQICALYRKKLKIPVAHFLDAAIKVAEFVTKRTQRVLGGTAAFLWHSSQGGRTFFDSSKHLNPNRLFSENRKYAKINASVPCNRHFPA
jgi:hypothetical protein